MDRKRNFESVLNLLKDNKISFESLKENIIPFEKAADAYVDRSNNLTTILQYSLQKAKLIKKAKRSNLITLNRYRVL